MTDKKTELLQNFTRALGKFVTEGLKGLRGEKAILVNAAHERARRRSAWWSKLPRS
jgi:hypothetical protein